MGSIYVIDLTVDIFHDFSLSTVVEMQFFITFQAQNLSFKESILGLADLSAW